MKDKIWLHPTCFFFCYCFFHFFFILFLNLEWDFGRENSGYNVWVFCGLSQCCSMSSAELDTLSPYTTHHGPLHRRLRDTQQCQHRRYGNTTYSLHKAHANQSDFNHIIDVYHKLVTVGEYYYNQRSITLRYSCWFMLLYIFIIRCRW